MSSELDLRLYFDFNESPEGLEMIRKPPGYFAGGHASVFAEEVTIPEGVVSLSGNCFESWKLLRRVKLPKSLRKIGDSCFNNCTKLEFISLPDGVNFIGRSCFSDCINLRSINIPLGVSELQAKCFFNSGLMQVKVPKNVKKIDDFCFFGCEWATLISMTGVEYLGSHSLAYNKSLEDVFLGDSLKYIGENAFIMSNKINFLYIPDSVLELKNSLDGSNVNYISAPERLRFALIGLRLNRGKKVNFKWR